MAVCKTQAVERQAQRPRIEVDYNNGDDGVAYLDIVCARQSFEAAGVEPRDGLLVRIWDYAADEAGEPATLEVDAVVRSDAERYWRAEYDHAAVALIPRY